MPKPKDEETKKPKAVVEESIPETTPGDPTATETMPQKPVTINLWCRT